MHAAKGRGRRVVCLLEHARWAQLSSYVRRGLQYIHLIRDPLEVCVSGYQYHLNTTEPWVLERRPESAGSMRTSGELNGSAESSHSSLKREEGDA